MVLGKEIREALPGNGERGLPSWSLGKRTCPGSFRDQLSRERQTAGPKGGPASGGPRACQASRPSPEPLPSLPPGPLPYSQL